MYVLPNFYYIFLYKYTYTLLKADILLTIIYTCEHVSLSHTKINLVCEVETLLSCTHCIQLWIVLVVIYKKNNLTPTLQNIMWAQKGGPVDINKICDTLKVLNCVKIRQLM